MKKIISFFVSCFFLVGVVYAQQLSGTSAAGATGPKWPQLRGPMSHDPNFKRTSQLSFYKRKSEWRKIIDSTWGPGLPLVEKLNVFDYYSGHIRAHNPTFAYTRLNWDSVSAHWRAKITDSTSRGGFSAILSHLARELTDSHIWAMDTIMYATQLNPGTPILVGVAYDLHDWGAVSHFGAGLTTLPDSSLLVYMVVPNHPLGLEPGDIVLGYEGVPWHDLVRELMTAGIPAVQYNACSPSASEYYLLFCAGMNWHLFDTIDVVKYKTGQTVHLSVDPLINLKQTGGLVNGAQLPVPGVPMPSWAITPDGFPTSSAVTYGIVGGTNIGYIYVYHHQNDNVGMLFYEAVAALAQTHGLVIDIRYNQGGWSPLNDGIARLTTYAGPTLESLKRSSPNDLWSLVPTQTEDFSIPEDGVLYQHPVAVLLGPTCLSYGDYTAHELTYLNNVRFFGEPPHGAYGGVAFAEPKVPGFHLECPDLVIVDAHSPNTQLWGKEFPLDEHVWLTQDGVAKGEDDVVKRAVQWINTLSYAHNVQLAHVSKDTLGITARVENPLSHSLKVAGILRNGSGVLIDSVLLKDDGLHGDSLAADGLWGYQYVPKKDDTIQVTIRTDDLTTATSRTLPNIATIPFTRGALINADTSPINLGPISMATSRYDTSFRVWNSGFASDSLTVSLEPGIVVPDTAVSAFPTLFTLAPGDSQKVTFSIRPGLLPPRARYSASVIVEAKSAFGQTKFQKKYQFGVVISSISDLEGLPTVFVLRQNYPNPFNPSTTIKYELPHASRVILRIYNTLGQEVATLVDETKAAGVYTVQFDAGDLASGVYFYRIEAGSFAGVKKLVLLR